MTDPRDLQAALAWLAVPHVGERTLLALIDHAREARASLTDLWESPPNDLARLVTLHPRALEALRGSRDAYWERAGIDLNEAHLRGAELLLAGDPEYPAQLWPLSGKQVRRWPFVFAFGALGLLEERGVVIGNSKEVSAQGLAVTDALADALARRDVPVVTSTNREAYQASATATKRHAGASVMVLDRGMAALPGTLDREPVASARIWDEAFDPELQLLLSPFGWRIGWTARNGRIRDSLIFDLAGVVVAVEVRAGGHIEAECRRAAERGVPVLVVARPGNGENGTQLHEEGLPAVRTLRWTGAEAAAEEIVRLLPDQWSSDPEERLLNGWLREVAAFLCRFTVGQYRRRPSIGCSPERGVLAATARHWAGDGSASEGVEVFLADLWSAPGNPARLNALLQRVKRGGWLAAVIPACWLSAEEHAMERAGWLREAELRAAVSLPAPTRVKVSTAPAAVLLRRGAGVMFPQSFIPERPEMGRFHLRRYLREVLEAARASEAACLRSWE